MKRKPVIREKHITIRINESEVEMLESYQRRWRMNRSEVIRKILKGWDDARNEAA